MHRVFHRRTFISRRSACRAGLALLLASVTLLSATVALAAHPKKGARFHGKLAGAVINGFSAPVSFKVSASGRTLLKFTFGTLGCFGAGGFKKGVNVYTLPGNLVNVGTIKVSGSGRFSVTNRVTVIPSNIISSTFTTTVSGRFTGPKSVSGSVSFGEKFSAKAICTAPAKSFSAKA